MAFPEPHTIPEYQQELLRAWGAVLRVEDKARKLADAVQSLESDCEILRHRANDLVDTINHLKKSQ